MPWHARTSSSLARSAPATVTFAYRSARGLTWTNSGGRGTESRCRSRCDLPAAVTHAWTSPNCHESPRQFFSSCVVAISAAVVACALLGLSEPNALDLAAPTGPSPVGTTRWVVTDSSRQDPFERRHAGVRIARP